MKTSTGYPYLKVGTGIVAHNWVDISKLTEFQIDTILHNFHIRRDGTGGIQNGNSSIKEIIHRYSLKYLTYYLGDWCLNYREQHVCPEAELTFEQAFIMENK